VTRRSVISVEPAGATAVTAASIVLASSFGDYPWTALTVAADQRTERLRSIYQLILGEVVVPHGRLWVARESTGRLVGAAGWLSPRSDPPPLLMAKVDDEVRRLRGERAAAAARAEQAVAAVAAESWDEAPHWFLGTVGVMPTTRGLGVGTALLAAGLHAVDADGAVARLETSLERNVRMYERVGFTVSGVALAEDVPCWLMQREPQPGACRQDR
jgi:ribosomal protein S18 acetylase RimI-like enzyme